MENSNIHTRAVPAVKRDCYFPDEYKLEMYQVSQYSPMIGQLYRYSSLIGQLYSQSGCIFECKMRIGKAKTMGGCTPWFYPSKGDMHLSFHQSLNLLVVTLQTRTCATPGRRRYSCLP